MRLVVVGMIGGVFVAACGGAAESPAQTPSQTNPSTAAPESVHTAGVADRSPEVANARGEIDRAERQIGASQGDCAAACRALASMERAAEHLCALDSGVECGHARDRVEAARERVRASCGGCGS